MMELLRFNALLLPGVLLFAGCSDPYERTDEDLVAMAGGEPLKETVVVSGMVTIDGVAAGGVQISAYTREEGTDAADRCRTRDDGTFCFTMYRGCDGMVPGNYRLAFERFERRRRGDDWRDRTDLLLGRYSNPMKNDFVLEVKSGEPQTDLLYELTSGT